MRTLLVDGGLAVPSWRASGSLKPFVARVLKARRLYDCDATIVAWDAPRDTTWRRTLSPSYKVKRPPPDQHLHEALDALRADLPCLDIAQASAPAAEADDVLYTLSRTRPRGSSLIYSSDKDLLQAIAPDVDVLRAGTRSKPDEAIHLETCAELTGLSPAGWRDYLALAGDSTDGVPGLPGVGPTKAKAILAACPHFVDLVLDDSGDGVELARQQCFANDARVAKWVEVAIEHSVELRLSLELVSLRLVAIEYVDAEPDEGRAAEVLEGAQLEVFA